MKLLYIACNPPQEPDLTIEKEINELTLRISAIPGDKIQSVFLPHCEFEELPHTIIQHRPDILHIAAHSDDAHLYMANTRGDKIPVTGEMLAYLLPSDHPPRLVYLNSCNSKEMADALKAKVPIVIATRTPISNKAARASAATFYSRVAEGATLIDAFHAANASGQGLQSDGGWELVCQPTIDPKTTRLCPRFEIVARFHELTPARKSGGFYDLDVGVIGCPPDTTQVVIFTDESSFNIEADDFDESDMAFDLAMVARHSMTKGELWFEEEWPTDGDFRLYACAVSASGRHLTTMSLVADAIDRYHLKSNYRGGKVNRKVGDQHLAFLRAGPDPVAQVKKKLPSKVNSSVAKGTGKISKGGNAGRKPKQSHRPPGSTSKHRRSRKAAKKAI